MTCFFQIFTKINDNAICRSRMVNNDLRVVCVCVCVCVYQRLVENKYENGRVRKLHLEKVRIIDKFVRTKRS